MARIDALPSLEIIRGLKGILDFYVWKGLPCVRAWPQYRPAKQTAASLATALVFGAIVKAYNLLGDVPLEAYREDALDQTRTARDIMVTGAYGNLHEASMSDFLTLLQQSRDFLSDLTALLEALHSVNTDEIVVRTEHSVLPDGAATAAAQATQLAALQKLDDLQDALQSKALDRLLIRGMDQLISISEPLHSKRIATVTGADGWMDSNPVPAGQIWKVSNIMSLDVDNATTLHSYNLRRAGSTYWVAEDRRAIPADERGFFKGEIWLAPTDTIRLYFTGSDNGDDALVSLFGHRMTLET